MKGYASSENGLLKQENHPKRAKYSIDWVPRSRGVNLVWVPESRRGNLSWDPESRGRIVFGL